MAGGDDASPCNAGKLLIACPGLRDPNFTRSVVLLVDDNSEGALGFVLNDPADCTVSDLTCLDVGEELLDVPVFRGGPVATDRLVFAALGWDSEKHCFSFSTLPSAEAAEAACRRGLDVRAYAGHSGWDPEQLRDEIDGDTWILTSPTPVLADPDPESIRQLWPRVLRGISPFHHLLSLTPEHPEHN